MRKLSIFLAVGAAASVAALVRPGDAWAPWAAFSDLNANVQQVCTNGAYLQIADVAEKATPEERAALPKTRASSIQAASPAPVFDEDTENYDPPDPADIVTSRNVKLPKKRFSAFYNDDPGLPFTKEYHRRFLVMWKKNLAPGAEVAISFDKFGAGPVQHRDVAPITVVDCKVHATRFSEMLLGSGRSETLDAKKGKDLVYGGGGRDRAFGREGHDKLYGGAGPDVLNGGPGHDRLYPGKGADVVRGGSGNDRVFARGGGKDNVDCGTGFDRVWADWTDVVWGNCEVIFRG